MCPRSCTCIDFPIGDSYMLTGHSDGKVRFWDLNERKVSAETGKAQVETITGIRTYNKD